MGRRKEPDRLALGPLSGNTGSALSRPEISSDPVGRDRRGISSLLILGSEISRLKTKEPPNPPAKNKEKESCPLELGSLLAGIITRPGQDLPTKSALEVRSWP